MRPALGGDSGGLVETAAAAVAKSPAFVSRKMRCRGKVIRPLLNKLNRQKLDSGQISQRQSCQPVCSQTRAGQVDLVLLIPVDRWQSL